LATTNLALELVVVLVELDETHSHIVDLRQLMLLDALLLIWLILQTVDLHVRLLHLALSLIQIGSYSLQIL